MPKQKSKRDLTDISRIDPTNPNAWKPLDQLDWFAKLDAGKQKTCSTLANLAEQDLIAFNGAVSVRIQMVKFIHDKFTDPELARNTLRARGYNEPRVAELLRVAAAGPELLHRLETAAIGFKAALAEARGKTKPSKAAKEEKLKNKSFAGFVKLARKSWKKEIEETGKHVEEDENGLWRITIEYLTPKAAITQEQAAA